MFRLNLKIALRNLWKNKGYTLINLLGLSIGMASCILIFIFINYQLSFDKDFKNGDRIYRVVSDFKYADGNDFYTKGVPRPLAPAMRNDFPQLEYVAKIEQDGGIIKVKGGNGKADFKINEYYCYYTEPVFFKIFNYQWLYSSPTDALSQPNTVVLSEKTADTYFGNWQNAIGKSINFNNATDFKVTGIIKDSPENCSLPLKVIFSLASYKLKDSKHWGGVSSGTECYVLLKEGFAINELDKPLQQFIKKYYVDNSPGKSGHTFQALNDIHHNEKYGSNGGPTVPYKQLYGMGIIALFLLLTACINFINLATAQAVSRGKEVGVRKVMGSRRKQLVMQFLSETTLITLIALLMACVLAELCLPSMEGLFKLKIAFSLFQHPIMFIFLLALVIVVRVC